jgi:hypothetical protein
MRLLPHSNFGEFSPIPWCGGVAETPHILETVIYVMEMASELQPNFLDFQWYGDILNEYFLFSRNIRPKGPLNHGKDIV